MVPVANKPFLEHQIIFLRDQGLTEILLLVGYLGEKIKDAFGDGNKHGVRLSYSHEAMPLGTGGALKLAQSKLRDEFLLLNGDTYLPIKYQDPIDCFAKFRQSGLVIACENVPFGAKANLAVAPNMQVIDCCPNGSRLTHINAGVGIFNRSVLDIVPEGQICSLENEVFPQLIARRTLWAYATDLRYYDMGTLDGLKALANFLNPGATSHLASGAPQQ